jgi:omega-amidase
MRDLTITLIQSELHWESTGANLAMFEEKIWKIKDATDLIILPEMFTTGFTMNAKSLAEPMNLTTFRWMKQQAAQSKAVVTGSYIVQAGGQYFNRLLWMEPNGNFSFYDKRHLFRMAREHEIYQGGSQKIVQELHGWKICPLICYDLRFPVWSRNVNNEFDLLLFVANWPEIRSLPWKVLLQARAIENLCYVGGVNRVGTDGKDIAYSGDSSIFNFKGELLYTCTQQEDIHSETLSKKSLLEFREKFPAYLDADRFRIEG